MDLNLSKIQYQQYAEGGSFQPVTPVETARGMEQELSNYGQDLRNYYDSKQYNDKINITNAKIRGEDLVQLADYSQSLAKGLVDQQKIRNENARKEEYSRMYQQGVPEADMARYQEQKKEMEAAYAEGNYTKAQLIKQGVPWLLTNSIDQMSGWRKVGAVEGLTESLATNQYPVAQQQFLADLDEQYPGMSTPEKQLRLENWRRGWMSEVGFDRTNPALLEEKAFPQMRRTDAVALGAMIQKDEARAKDNLEEEGNSLMATNPVTNYTRAQEYYIATGRYNRAEARKKALSQVNSLTELDKIAGSTSWDGKTPNGTKYRKDFDDRKVAMLREAEGRRDYDIDAQQLAGQQYADQQIEAWSQSPPSLATVEQAVNNSRNTYGGYVDPRLNQYLQNNVDATKKKAWKEYLNRRLAAGTLSQALLNDPDIPWDVAQEFRGKVPDAEVLTKSNSAEIGQLNKDVERSVSKEDLPIETIMRTPGIVMAQEHAKALYLQRRQQNITGGMSVADASKEAYDYVKGLIDMGNPDLTKDGKPQGIFAFNQKGGFYEFTKPNAGLQASRAAARQEINRVDNDITLWNKEGRPPEQIVDNVQLLPDSALDDAVKNSSGYGWKPSALAEYISVKTGGRLSAWEVTERQAQAFRGQGIFIPSAIRAADEQIPPEHKQALNTFPSYNRTMRASASTNGFMPRTIPQNLGTEVEQLAQENGIDPALLAGVVSYETKNFSGDVAANTNVLEQTAPLLGQLLQDHNGDVNAALISMGVGRGESFASDVLRNATKYGYGANENVFRQPAAMNPTLAYLTGNIGPTSTGPHLDVKRVDRGFFEYSDLDDYVVIDDPEFGRVPLSRVRETGDWMSHTRRGSHGRDYGTASNTKVYLRNGARVVGVVQTVHGDKLTIELPTGEQYTFLHGSAAN